jgi:hypothetical protein
MGSNEFFSEFARKMSAKDVLITARNPYCVSAQGRMLARAAATEVVAGQQDLRRPGFRQVEDEARLRFSIGVVAPIVEKLVAEAVFRNRFQKSRGDDLVGIDVVDRERNHAAFETA